MEENNNQNNNFDSSINFGESKYQRNILKSLLLLILTISGNFIVSTLSCKMQREMTTNVFVKQFILLFVIYLTFTALDPNANEKSPLYSIKNTFIIWIFYLMFTKQTLNVASIIIGLLLTAYISDQFVTYYEKNITQNNLLKISEKIRCYTFNASVFLIIVGFINCFLSKKQEYGINFDTSKFIFGIPVCIFIK